MIFGVVSLLVVLAIVGLVVSKQLKATRQGALASTTATVAGGGASAPATLAEQSRQLQKQVQADVAKALEHGARKDEADR
jgi:uncharacterized membrane protein